MVTTPKISTQLNFPELQPFDIKRLTPPSTLIFATGFEPRSLHIASELQSQQFQTQSCILIEYEPQHKGNLVTEAKRVARSLIKAKGSLHSLKYTRFSPDDFLDNLDSLISQNILSKHVIVDISAMSKFLILLLLSTLFDHGFTVTVVYTEAKTYFPLKTSFAKALKTESASISDFLTTGVHQIVSTHRVSSVGMLGAPILLVAFPTFNKSDVVAVLNEIPFQRVALIEERSEDRINSWRLPAIQQLNKGIQGIVSDRFTASVIDYRETFDALTFLALKYSSTNQIAISPTGSKLQTIGVALFRLLFPETQFIYPPTPQFRGPLSTGISKTLMLDFEEGSKLIDRIRKLRGAQITAAIDAALA